MRKLNTTINIPKNIKIVVWKKINKEANKICLIHKHKVMKLNYHGIINIDKWSNVITFKKIKNNNINLYIENKINNFLNSLNIYYFNKIKFKGKGFRIKFFKKIKLLKFFFGRSHKTFMFLKKINRKKINKYKFMLFGINLNNLKNVNFIINKIKKINFYTLRGLRNSRQIIYKRKGKKGTYI